MHFESFKFAIKVRETGNKSWAFLANNGTNRLRVHASTFKTKADAQRLIEANRSANPSWEWKVVSL